MGSPMMVNAFCSSQLVVLDEENHKESDHTHIKITHIGDTMLPRETSATTDHDKGAGSECFGKSVGQEDGRQRELVLKTTAPGMVGKQKCCPSRFRESDVEPLSKKPRCGLRGGLEEDMKALNIEEDREGLITSISIQQDPSNVNNVSPSTKPPEFPASVQLCGRESLEEWEKSQLASLEELDGRLIREEIREDVVVRTGNSSLHASPREGEVAGLLAHHEEAILGPQASCNSRSGDLGRPPTASSVGSSRGAQDVGGAAVNILQPANLGQPIHNHLSHSPFWTNLRAIKGIRTRQQASNRRTIREMCSKNHTNCQESGVEAIGSIYPQPMVWSTYKERFEDKSRFNALQQRIGPSRHMIWMNPSNGPNEALEILSSWHSSLQLDNTYGPLIASQFFYRVRRHQSDQTSELDLLRKSKLDSKIFMAAALWVAIKIVEPEYNLPKVSSMATTADVSVESLIHAELPLLEALRWNLVC